MAVALVAGFAVSSPTASLLDAFKTPTGDKDKDNVPDEEEKILCGIRLIRETIAAHVPVLGRCTSDKDWTPAREIVVADLPTSYTKGADMDKDGFPTRIELTWTRVDINPFRADYVIMRPVTTTTPVPLDDLFSDADANLPVVSKIDVPNEIPTMVVLGKEDRDFDGLPAQLTVKTSKVSFDRRLAEPLALTPSADIPAAVDTNDNDASQPVVSVVGPIQVITGAGHDGDGDGDMIPHALKFEWLDVTIDRRTSAAEKVKMVTSRSILVVDDADTNRDNLVPFSLIDKDKDVYPDEVEKIICLVQYEHDDLDGKCVGDDYFAPTGVPNPWRLR